MRFSLIALPAALAINDDTLSSEAGRVTVEDSWCNGVDKIFLELKFQMSTFRSGVLLGHWRGCDIEDPGWSFDKKDGSGPVDASDTEGVLSFNPYTCNSFTTPAASDNMSDFNVAPFEILFASYYTLGGIDVEFHTYDIELACTFRDSYSVDTRAQIGMKQTAIDVHPRGNFILDDTAFALELHNENQDGATPTFRANDYMTASLRPYSSAEMAEFMINDPTRPDGKAYADDTTADSFDKMHEDIEFAPISCKVVQGTDPDSGAEIEIFNNDYSSLSGSDQQDYLNENCGLPSILFQMSYTTTDVGSTRYWLFRYIAFVFASDDDGGSYYLSCDLQVCHRNHDGACDRTRACSAITMDNNPTFTT